MKKIWKKHKVLILIAVAAIIVYFLFFRNKTENTEEEEAKNLPENTSSGNTGCSPSRETVKLMQRAANRVLEKQGKTELVVDGIYGPKTTAAINSLIGKKACTYNEVKRGVIAWFEAKGLGNPYTPKTSSSSSYDSNYVQGSSFGEFKV